MTTRVPIKHLFDVSRNMITPTDFGNEPLFHYSLPAWHEHGDGIIENASDLASGKLLLRGGEVLVSKLNPEKNAVLLGESHEIPTVCSPEFIALVPRKIDRQFAYYFMLSAPLRHQLNASVESVTNSHKRARVDRFLASNVDLPNLATQRQIADFLDRETARIDLLIEKKQRLVALLGEKLQAEISTLVKRGASDQSIRLRHVARLNPSARGLRLEPDASVTFCPMEAIHDGVGGIDTSHTRPISEVASASYNFFEEGDILLAKVTPCFENGKKALARDLINGVGFATSEVFVVRVDPKKTSPEYLVYLFSSDDFQYAGRTSMTGAGGLRRTSERSILDFPLFVTDRVQQQEIVGKIDKKVGISRKIIAKTNASIDRLKEYRSALITAAVTGQIDVTTYAKSGTPDRRLDAIQEEMGA